VDLRLDYDVPVKAIDFDKSEIRNSKTLKSLHGYKSKDSDSNLLTHAGPPLNRVISKGHNMQLVFENGQLLARFSFHIIDDTPQKMIGALTEYVDGQLQDGFGEGQYWFGSKTSKASGVRSIQFTDVTEISPSFVNDGVKVRKPSPSKKLLWAAEDGDVEYIRSAVARGQKLDVVSKFKSTPLTIAILHKNVDCVRALLEGGADMNAAVYQDTINNNSPVKQNSMSGQTIVKVGNETDPYKSKVIEDGRALEIAKILQEHGANWNEEIGGEYERPIQWALNRESYALIEYYLQNGADPNYRRPYNDYTLIMTNPKPKSAELLIRYGLNVQQRSKDGLTTKELLLARMESQKSDDRFSDKYKQAVIKDLQAIIDVIDLA